jgi:integrase
VAFRAFARPRGGIPGGFGGTGTYASGLIAAGCDVVAVQRALGHRSATVTLNTYGHLWAKAEYRTRNAAAAMMAETLGSADTARTGEGG